jgi:hypothetical protein
MNPWLDGLTVLANEWQITAAILLCAAGSQALTGIFLSLIFDKRLAPLERFTLSLSGWTLPPLLLALLWYLTKFDGLFWIFLLSPLIFALFRVPPDLQPGPSALNLLLLLFLFLTLPLRLAYVLDTDLPLYFDSAQHYLLIKTLLLKQPALLWGWLNSSYYHVGFHFLAAFLTAATGAEIARVMLILGQVILWLLAVPVFVLVYQQTNSITASGFALLLAAFGWYMPAHAVNWGKYPALMSLGLIPFTISLAVLIRRHANGLSASKRWLAYGALAASVLLTLLTHSRSVIALGMILLAWAVATRLEKSSSRAMRFAPLFIAALVMVQSIVLLKQNMLALVFDPYLFEGAAVTAIVLLLVVCAWRAYPRLTLISLLTVTAMLGALRIPVTFLPSFPALTLLDRPYVEMALWLPLSVLGGAGLAGMRKVFQKRWMWNAVVLLAGVVILVNARAVRRLYPSECCLVAGKDDLTAIAWLGEHLPLEARIGIASSPLRLTSASAFFEGEAGADAGIWITPLTGRTTILLSNASAFEQIVTLKQICELGIGYLYVGEKGQPFHSAALLARPAWYTPLLVLPKTGVYQVNGCEEVSYFFSNSRKYLRNFATFGATTAIQ